MDTTKPPLRDLKEGLSSARKPDITHVRTPFKVYTTRPSEYGTFKYVRSNYLRPVAPGGYTGTPTKEDFERLRSYARAADSHIGQVLDAMELYQAMDPDRVDIDGMKRAAYAVDIDEDVTGKVGPSFLPHIAAACASLNMAITQAVACGLLPADPGQPWRDEKCVSPYAEEARAKWRAAQKPAVTVTPLPQQSVASLDAGIALARRPKIAEAARILGNAWPSTERGRAHAFLTDALMGAGWTAEDTAAFSAQVADIREPGNGRYEQRLVSAQMTPAYRGLSSPSKGAVDFNELANIVGTEAVDCVVDLLELRETQKFITRLRSWDSAQAENERLKAEGKYRAAKPIDPAADADAVKALDDELADDFAKFSKDGDK